MRFYDGLPAIASKCGKSKTSFMSGPRARRAHIECLYTQNGMAHTHIHTLETRNSLDVSERVSAATQRRRWRRRMREGCCIKCKQGEMYNFDLGHRRGIGIFQLTLLTHTFVGGFVVIFAFVQCCKRSVQLKSARARAKRPEVRAHAEHADRFKWARLHVSKSKHQNINAVFRERLTPVGERDHKRMRCERARAHKRRHRERKSIR